MPTPKRRQLLIACLSWVALGAMAQDSYPDRPVTFVTWSSPGGNIDVAMRTVGDRLAQKWKQPVIAENRVGASGIIATDYVAKAKPDGYTVLVTTPTAQINTAFVKNKLPFDARKDFEPVSLMLTGQIAIVAAANAPYNNLAELVAYAKKQPNGITFGSWGVGSGGHLLGEQLRQQAQVVMVHVPYKGGELASMNDVIGGVLDTAFMANGNAKIPCGGRQLGEIQCGLVRHLTTWTGTAHFGAKGDSPLWGQSPRDSPHAREAGPLARPGLLRAIAVRHGAARASINCRGSPWPARPACRTPRCRGPRGPRASCDRPRGQRPSGPPSSGCTRARSPARPH